MPVTIVAADARIAAVRGIDRVADLGERVVRVVDVSTMVLVPSLSGERAGPDDRVSRRKRVDCKLRRLWRAVRLRPGSYPSPLSNRRSP